MKFLIYLTTPVPKSTLGGDYLGNFSIMLRLEKHEEFDS